MKEVGNEVVENKVQNGLAILAFSLLFAACGGTASPSFQEESPNLDKEMMSAIWYGDLGDRPLTPISGDTLVAEDGRIYSSSMEIQPSEEGSTHINGVFLVDIPDSESVRFVSQIA